MGVTFFSQKQLLIFSLSTKDTFLCTRPKSACGKSSSCRFSFSAARNAITQVKYVIFGFIFVFCFTFASRKFWATLSVWNTNCLLAAKRQATLDWERPTLCNSFSNLKQLIDDIYIWCAYQLIDVVRSSQTGYTVVTTHWWAFLQCLLYRRSKLLQEIN